MLPALAISGLLLLAAWRDIATRLIPDAIPLAILALGVALRLPLGHAQLLLSIALASVVFVVLLGVAMRGWLGGGDVKLAAAVAVALPPGAVWDFVFATAMVGGVLGLAYLAGPHLPVPRLQPCGRLPRRVLATEAWRFRRGGPLPYAVAIAAGGILVLSGH